MDRYVFMANQTPKMCRRVTAGEVEGVMCDVYYVWFRDDDPNTETTEHADLRDINNHGSEDGRSEKKDLLSVEFE